MKTKVNLLKGKFECCGVLCDKRNAQLHIDRMQRAIDKCNEYFSTAVYVPPKLEKLANELKELSNDNN